MFLRPGAWRIPSRAAGQFIGFLACWPARSSTPPAGANAAAEGAPTNLWEFSTGDRFLTGAALDVDGAVNDSGSPLMKSAWHRYQHDAQNTGRR